MSEQKYKIVDLPSYDFKGISQEEVTSGLVAFYEALGFDPCVNTVNPIKILLNFSDRDEMLNEFLKQGKIVNEKIAKDRKDCDISDLNYYFQVVWLNFGPKGSPEVKKGKVKLLDGYLIDSIE